MTSVSCTRANRQRQDGKKDGDPSEFRKLVKHIKQQLFSDDTKRGSLPNFCRMKCTYYEIELSARQRKESLKRAFFL